jgi:hypothetical protein
MKNKDNILLEQAYQQVQQGTQQPQQAKDHGGEQTYDRSKHGNYTSIYIGFDSRGQLTKAISGVDYNKLAPDIKSKYMQLTDTGYVFDPIQKTGSKISQQNINTPIAKQVFDGLKKQFPNMSV